MSIREELYSITFNALKHGVRRKVLLMLAEEPKSFTELYETLEISSSHLSYHLDILDGLLSKKGSKYQISESGKAALNMIKRTETSTEIVRTHIAFMFFKYLTCILTILIIGMIGFFVGEYQVSIDIIKNGLIDTLLYILVLVYPAVVVAFGVEYWNIPLEKIRKKR